MPRYRRRPAPRGRHYYDDYSYPRRRRGGCLAPIQRFLHTVIILLLIIVSIIIFVLLVFLIAFNFAVSVRLLSYALIIAVVLVGLSILYLVVRLLTAISHRISAASAAGSKAKLERERAKIERERVQQARIQVRAQEAKLYREDYAFHQKYEEPGSSQNPRRTRVLGIDDQPPVQPKPLLQSPSQTALQESELTELELLGMPAKGQVFRYRDYKKLLKPGELIIGIRKDGTPRIGSWQDFKITLILGSSSSGKSTTVLEKCVCHEKSAGLLVVCDPGGFKPDSLTQRLGSLKNALMPGTSLALEHKDIMQNLERFRAELERRRRGADMTTPILLVIDELNGLLMDKDIKKELTELIEKFAQQARGYNMYMILCAQRASGLAAIRNSVISFVCHKCPEMEAAKILPARYAKLAPQLGIGQTFVSDANGFIEPLQQIFITPEDIASSVGGSQYPTTQPVSPAFHSRQTEPIGPAHPSRQFGAPALQQRGKLVPHKTSLGPLPSPALATWKDTELITEPDKLIPPKPPTIQGEEKLVLAAVPEVRETEDLSKPQTKTQPDEPPQDAHPDPFARLAHLRKRKKESTP